MSCAGLWLPLPTADAGKRGHSCIKLLIFVSSTSVSDSEETEKKPVIVSSHHPAAGGVA